MTLHWWMHWFWVTCCLCFSVVLGAPVTSTTPENQILNTNISEGTISVVGENFVTPTNVYRIPEEGSGTSTGEETFSVHSVIGENDRVPKAIGIESLQPTNRESIGNNYKMNGSNKYNDNEGAKRDRNSMSQDGLRESNDTEEFGGNFNKNDSTPGIASSLKKDSKITWIITANKTSKIIQVTEEKSNVQDYNNNENSKERSDPLAVLPLQETSPTTRFKLVLNRTKFIPSTNVNDKIFDKSDDVELREDLIESKLLATAASVLQGISESPRLSRARSAFAGEYQQDQNKELQEQKREMLSENRGNASSSAIDVAAITGSCLASLVLLGTMGSLGFVMYRRKYLNPPQTLNSDKCSNPDSSGYIDDSTIRDNSEEMYSLDNDSFLNSLEAMTIQNYWTDSVKHTKL